MDNRGIRLKDAYKYLGIDKLEFVKTFRHLLTEARVGQKVIFDRLELDEIFDKYIMGKLPLTPPEKPLTNISIRRPTNYQDPSKKYDFGEVRARRLAKLKNKSD